MPASRLCMGTMTFGGQADEAESHRMLDRALDAGIDFFDTANMYTDGRSEAILGRWLQAAPGRRTQAVLASKVRYPVGDDEATVGLSRRNIIRQLEATLARLQTDHLDFYYLHAPDHHTPLEVSLHAFNDLVQAGKIRAYGMSNYPAWQMMEALALCERHGWAKPSVVQPMYNLIARDIEVEILPFARAKGWGVCAYNPLAAGLLTGKHTYSEVPPAGTRFGLNHHYVKRFWRPAHFEAVAALQAVAAEAGRSLIGLALQWALQQPGVSHVILGASKDAHLEANLAAVQEAGGAPLGADVQARLDAIYQALRGFPPVIVR